MRALYEINAEILSCLDQETGEIIDAEKLESLQLERSEKIEAVACYVKNLTSEANAIKEEEKALAERRKAKEKKIDGLRDYLKFALDGSKFETAKVNVSFRNSAACEITDEEKLLFYLENMGLDNCIEYQPAKIKKSEVGKLIKEGREIPGAQMVERQNIQIK